MINKELRFKGNVMRRILPSREKTCVMSYKLSKKIMSILFAGIDIKELKCSEIYIPRKRDKSKIRVRIYRPLELNEKVPAVLWIHGGGYAIGTPEQGGQIYKRLITERRCVVIAPDYRLSVDAPYPAALEDCYEVLLWMKNNAKELGIKDNQLIVGGESAGGGLTAALTLYARDKKEVNIAFQIPLYPMIDDRMITESSKDNDAPVWNSQSNRWAWKLYLGQLYGKDVPAYAAAARATDYKDLPPAITFVGDLEPFRDETLEYINNLSKAKVPVYFQLFKGCYHGFDILCPKAEVSKQATSFLMHSFGYAVDNYFAKQN
ncbi:alpha/beta hydrolase [Clostridium manihotivorum]|uniref:Alpha/beta hydrolase n=2 Tax=Clostridium manihotivorum TaxID=2320868 RepID=A0A410E1S0_9CLOT|nr:alpha/beta hydrolase [Clostridium manihotivorum]